MSGTVVPSHSGQGLGSANSGRAAPAGTLTTTHAQPEAGDCAGAGDGAGGRALIVCIMALRPQRTFRRRQVESSDSDSEGAEERPAEEPAEPCGPSAGGRAEGAAEPARRARGSRGRGRVWASSRRSPGTASRRDCDAGDRGTGRGLIRRSPAPEASTVSELPGLVERSRRFWWHVAVCILR